MLILVTENQLDAWVRGNALDAQRAIVELVWRLVAASCPSPRERRFPLGDSMEQHGPDGVLKVDLGDEPFIPEGCSYWEIGTSVDAGKKATSDYANRTEDTPQNIRRDNAFVFVTPLSGRRDWQYTWKEDAQLEWLEKRRRAGEWKDVRVIDGTRLVDWVHRFPSVELWLAQTVNSLPPHHIETPELRWNVLRTVGEPPPLTPDVFLAGREEACTKLREVFDDRLVQLKLSTHYPGQVADFISARVASLDGDSRVDVESRCLIVSDADTWNAICTQQKRHILVADTPLDLSGDAGTKLIQRARKAGHAVVYGGPYGGIPDPASVRLLTPRSEQIQEALAKAGYSDERARMLAQKSDGNLGSLLRCLQNLSVLPEWAEGGDAAELVIAAVLGAWTDKSDADRAIVEGLVGKTYGEWIGKIREIAGRPGTPLGQRDGNWRFLARYEGWYALGPRLFSEHLERLRAAAVLVLREKDPQFEMPKEQRYMAQIHGKVPANSRMLRTGLAESLALLGSQPKALTSCALGKAESVAALAIREILGDADWLQWASLNDVLPLLAEAAPAEFLDAVERALASQPCPFANILAQEGDGIFGRNYLTGLLWALETLAWDADHLTRVVICLGELDTYDHGGQWTNRPTNSLTTILLPWMPQTCAPIAKRVSAVKALLAELPAAAWKLLLKLLPESHSVSSGTRRPAWRGTIPDDWQQGVTALEYWSQVRAYAELALGEARTDASKLATLLEHLENLPPPARDQLLEYLASDGVVAMPEEGRQRLWTKLVDLLTRHRKFADAEWALKPQQIEEIVAIADRLAPTSPFFRHQRLFSDREFDLHEKIDNFEEQQKEMGNRRQQAVREVAANGGVDAVLAFAEVVQAPWRVGMAFGVAGGKDADGAILPRLLESERRPLAQFAGGFVSARFRSQGWKWVDGVDFSQWTSAQIGQLLSFLPFDHDTWQRCTRLLGRDESAYWAKTAANPYEAGKDTEFAIDQLLSYGRPYAAIRCLHHMLSKNHSIDNERAVRVLLAALRSSEEPNSMDAYETIEIIKVLQDDPSTSTDDLLRIEWAYLPLLDKDRSASPKFLERRLAREPGFFCEVIRLVFRSKKQVPPAEEPSEDKIAIVANAYRLLSDWRVPPGLREDGTYDGGALKAWLEAVKKECAETGHLEVAMTMVGQVLVHTPPDPDGLWIHRSAAEVLNAKDAEDACDGFSTARYNSRGVHWVDPTGKPERELAAACRKQAEEVEGAGYPRLATTLREMANAYEHEAERISSRDIFDD